MKHELTVLTFARLTFGGSRKVKESGHVFNLLLSIFERTQGSNAFDIVGPPEKLRLIRKYRI